MHPAHALIPALLAACPPAGLQFRSATYHALAARLKRLADELCGGRLVFLLEVRQVWLTCTTAVDRFMSCAAPPGAPV